MGSYRLFFVFAIFSLAASVASEVSNDCSNQMKGHFENKIQASSSGNYNKSSPAWKAFDGNPNTMWLSETYQTPAWIEFDFKSRTYVNQYSIKYSNGSITSRAPKAFILQGKTLGRWKVLDRRFNESNWGGSEIRKFSIGDPGLFYNYRLVFEDDNDKKSGNVMISIGEIKFLNCNYKRENISEPVDRNKPFVPSNFRGKYIAKGSYIELTWNKKSNNDQLTDKYKIYYVKPYEEGVYVSESNKDGLYYDTRISLIDGNTYKLKVPNYHSGAWRIAISAVSENKVYSNKSDVITVFLPTEKVPRVNNRRARQEGKRVSISWDYYAERIPDLVGFQITLNDKLVVDEKTLTATTNKWLSPSYDFNVGDNFVFKLRAVTLYGVKSEETTTAVTMK